MRKVLLAPTMVIGRYALVNSPENLNDWIVVIPGEHAMRELRGREVPEMCILSDVAWLDGDKLDETISYAEHREIKVRWV